ncbi:MAG: glycosyltransferase family 39 protein [Pseudomonadota bacterium]
MSLERASSVQTTWLIMAGLALLVIATRMAGFPPETMWLDEIFSAVFAVQPIIDTVIAVLRFDLHPPLYYIQLNMWALVSHSETWLFANSLFWVAVASMSVYWVAKRLFSEPIAITAALLFILLPSVAYYSLQMRPHVMLSCIAIWVFYFNHIFPKKAPAWRLLILMAMAELVLIYSHAIGIFMVGFPIIYGFICLFEGTREHIKRWFIAHILVGLAAIPVLLNSLVRSVGHTKEPGLAEVSELLALLIGGRPLVELPGEIGKVIGVAFFILLAILAFRVKTARLMVFIVVLLPLAMAIVVSHTIRPIWLNRIFVFMTPILCMGISVVVWHTFQKNRTRLIAVASLGFFMAIASFINMQNPHRPQNYREVSSYLVANMQPGDRVYMLEFMDFWAMGWYLKGPDWGSPLKTQSPVAAGRWSDILERIGPVWQERFRLVPEKHSMVHNGSTFLMGPAPIKDIVHDGPIWVVFHRSIPAVATSITVLKELTEHGFEERHRATVGGLSVRLLTPSAQTASTK